jgi:ribose 1,5-bisphosphokinase PhnN
MTKYKVIAVDGPSGSGKGTICKELSKLTGYFYVDSGVYYRAITYLVQKNNVDPEDIISKKRSSEFTNPRHVFMYLCRNMTDTTLKGIAALLERDHTTVMHGIDKISNEIDNNPELKETIKVLKNKITSS